MQGIYTNKTDTFLCVKGSDGLTDFGANLHSSVEVVLLLEGETKVWIENKEAITARSGDAIIIFPNQQYRYETKVKEEYILLAADIRRRRAFERIFLVFSRM